MRTSMRTAEGSVGHGGGLESREFLQIASIGTYRICRRICRGICYRTKGGRGVRASLNAKSGHFFGIGEFSRFLGGLSPHATQILRMLRQKCSIFAGGASKRGSIASRKRNLCGSVRKSTQFSQGVRARQGPLPQHLNMFSRNPPKRPCTIG